MSAISALSPASACVQLDAVQPPDETWVVLGGPCSLHDVGALERDGAPKAVLAIMAALLKQSSAVWRVGGILSTVLDGVATAEDVATV